MWNQTQYLDKYQYARTNAHVVRVLSVLGAISALLMGYGFWRFLRIDKVYLLIFGPLIFIFIVNKFLRYVLQLFFQGFDIKKHERFVNKYWAEHEEPSVDVFLPYAGEALDVHEQVVKAVSELNYKNYKVYMLDDAGDENHRALAEKYGFTYLSRPNKGEYKKSGNLEYGYANSTGKFIFILDADFVPTKGSLKDLVPYIDSDSKIGILQTPQYFEQSDEVHNRSKIEFGGGNIVEEFYRIIMPCRDEFKAAMCVGTSAIYRRETIQLLDGTPKVHASEDLATGLLVTQHGYYVKYLPLIVSIGTSPETYQGYFKQHLRWCSGNLVFAQYWPKAKLSLMARLVYIINPLYYLSEASSVIFSFQFLMLLYFHPDTLSIANSLYFIPYIIVSRLLVPATRVNKSRVGTKLAALNNSYTYLYTYIHMLTKGVPAWHPTGVKISGLHNDFVSSFNLGMTISSLHIILFTFVLFARSSVFGNYNTYLVLGWSFYTVLWHSLYLYSVAKYIHPYLLNNVRNNLGRMFLFAKTHAIMALTLTLFGTSAFSATKVLKNPETPTTQALNNLMDSEADTNTLALLSPFVEELKNSGNVLAATDTPIPSPFYQFNYSEEITLLGLAVRALESYAEETGVQLTPEEISYVAELIIERDEYKKEFQTDEIIIFGSDVIAQLLETEVYSSGKNYPETTADTEF